MSDEKEFPKSNDPEDYIESDRGGPREVLVRQDRTAVDTKGEIVLPTDRAIGINEPTVTETEIAFEASDA